VIAFDRRLRSGLADDEIEELRQLLVRLEANVRPSREPGS